MDKFIPMEEPKNILIIFWYEAYPARQSVLDHLYCFRDNNFNNNIFYWNIGLSDRPQFCDSIKWDLVIYHDLFFCGRWGGTEFFNHLIDKVSWTKNLQCKKFAMPQDEFIHSIDLSRFIKDFSVDVVFSVSPESEWPKIYNGVDFSKTKFYEALTGYLNEKTVVKTEHYCRDHKKTIDVGYRAGGRSWRQASWLGKHGLLKIQLADVVQDYFSKHTQFKLDISTDSTKTLMGFEWMKFLASSKFTLGVEGGASILDADGTLREKTLQYVKIHPDCSYEDIVRNCLGNAEGSLALYALSPRHLEAPVARTCQILINGNYNGILKPDVHFIPMNPDFSNLDEVIKKMKDDKYCEALITNSYRDIVASGRYSYKSYVRDIFSKNLISINSSHKFNSNFIHSFLNLISDRMGWLILFAKFSPKSAVARKAFRGLKKVLKRCI